MSSTAHTLDEAAVERAAHGLRLLLPRGPHRGKVGEVQPLMWIVSVLFVLYFGIHPLTDWLS